MTRADATANLLVLVLCLFVCCHLTAATVPNGGHTNNWAVIVNTSRYWFNYRHVANALSIYTIVKRLGIPDSNILLLLADDIPCNPRNPYPTSVFNNANQQTNLYDDTVEVDYRGYEVTAQSFLDLLNGHHNPAVPRSKRLLSNNQSNVLVYITGHGGDGFMKFQDKDEATADEIGDAFAKMWAEGRYKEVIFISDTCQAASLYGKVRSPNLIAMASSRIGEDSLSHHVDYHVGLSVIDRFTYFMLDFFQGISGDSTATLQDLVDHVRPKPLQSTFCSKTFDYPHALNTVPVINFFGDKQRFRSRKNKPVAALQQCQSLLDNSKVYAEHTWQAPNEMQVANRKSLTFLPDDTGAPWHPGQCQVSNRIVVALMVVMLLAAMNVSRWPGTHEHASKSALASRVDINAVAHT